jgi:hypothetical protein
VLPAGIHRFNFSAILPPEIPCDMREQYGYVSYTASLKLERPKKSTFKHKVKFHVRKDLDLNLEYPRFNVPRITTARKRFGFFCFKSKPLQMAVTIPTIGLAPGSVIRMITDIENPTCTKVKSIRISFCKRVSYTSQYPYQGKKDEVKTLKTEVCEGTVRNGSRTYEKMFEIPSPLKITSHCACLVMEIAYEFNIKCVVSGFSIGPDIRIPIIIGTVPYREVSVEPRERSLSLPSYTQVLMEEEIRKFFGFLLNSTFPLVVILDFSKIHGGNFKNITAKKI